MVSVCARHTFPWPKKTLTWLVAGRALQCFSQSLVLFFFLPWHGFCFLFLQMLISSFELDNYCTHFLVKLLSWRSNAAWSLLWAELWQSSLFLITISKYVLHAPCCLWQFGCLDSLCKYIFFTLKLHLTNSHSLSPYRSTSKPPLWRTSRRTAAWSCVPFWNEPWRGTLLCGARRPSCWRTRPSTRQGMISRAAGASTRPWRRSPTPCCGSRASTTTPYRVRSEVLRSVCF